MSVGVAERAWLVEHTVAGSLLGFTFCGVALFLDQWISSIEWVQRPGVVGWQVALSLTETGKSA